MEKIKIYFEDGLMKIRIPEEDTIERRRFLRGLGACGRDWTEEKNVLYVLEECSWGFVAKAAHWPENINNVECSQEVEDFHQEQLRIARERVERERRIEDLKRTISWANTRQTNGCGFCEHLEYVPAHWEDLGNGEKQYVAGRHFCNYAVSPCRYRWDDIEYAFEVHKEVQAFGTPLYKVPKPWVAPPYPCAGCEHLEKAEKAWEELEKEKENG